MSMPVSSIDDRSGVAPAPRAGPAWLESTPTLLALLALWLLATLGLRPLLVPDEGRYGDVARTMAESGTLDGWLVPTLNGLPFFHKPPLFYWLDMAAMQVLGVNAFSARFGSACGAWLMGAALLLALRRAHGPRAAAFGLGVLATTPFFFLGAQYANHDMLVGGLISAAILALVRALDDGTRIDRRWLVAGWVLCALALLAKGLIGFVLPALVIGPWLLAQRRWRELLKLLHPLGLLAFALVGLPWFIAMQWRYPAFFDYFVVEQHFRRFEQSNFNNVHGVWFFIVVMPALTLPWSAWLAAALRRVGAAWRVDATLGLYAWWIVAVLGFFSIPSSKLVGYALPALAPWCALLALAVAASAGRAWRWALVAASVGCLAIVFGLAWQTPKSNRAAALQLAARLASGERVVMVDEYFYDLPFYAGLREPALVASDWADPDLPRHDNWRKELYDAARFDPARGAELLWPLARLDALSCGRAAVWFVVTPGGAARVAGLTGAQRIYHDKHAELWHAPPRACP